MSEELNPITREEMFLAKAAGQNVPALTPITRVERFLQNLIDHIKSIGSGGSGGGAFYVTVTVDEENGYTADKTVAEITEAYEAGKPVYCKFAGDMILPFVGFLEGYPIFASTLGNVQHLVDITEGNVLYQQLTIAYHDEIPEYLPSPGKLIFDGAVSGSYNGSDDVTITIPTAPTVADILAALPTWNGGSY